MMRPTRDQYFVDMAELSASRSTCCRRSVGCVLVDEHGHVLATGYNGVARGEPHCNEGHPCPGYMSASGTDLDLCDAVHAEQNALIQCRDHNAIHTAYVTCLPCVTCARMLKNTSVQRLVVMTRYAAGHDDRVERMFREHVQIVIMSEENI